ncbi:hypothetical protein Trydic_g1372 [Trypoxylus dichotomus]
MIASRGSTLLRNAIRLRYNIPQVQQSIRNSHHWQYRSSIHEQPKILTTASEFIAGVMWWWILWHLWTEPGHVFGEFEYPIASQWTDAELGIPEE